VRHVLVVCTANQCRSPMAEALIRARLTTEGVLDEVGVSSAGTWADAARPATPHAIAAMAERGIDIAGHRSSELDLDRLAGADLILVMTASHREAIVAEFPTARDRTRLFSALTGGEWNVEDPVGKSLDDYRATADELERLIDAGWLEIIGDPRAS
jgi:protein-tyrosine-phosphatase